MAGAMLAAIRRRQPTNGGAQAPRTPNNGGAPAPNWSGGKQGLGTRILNAGRQQQNNGGAPAPGGARPGAARPPGVPAPTSPPPGYYDPTIDAQVRASQRGLGDLLGDNQTARSRGFTDFTLAGQDIFRNRDEQLADARVGFDRGTADSTLAEQRTNQDYGSAISNLQLGYQRLGGQQGQALSAAGLGGGTAFAQAAAKRAGNMALDRAPIDTTHDRGIADILTSRSRMGEDYATGTRRIGEAADRGYGQLSLQYQRQGEDLGTSDQRAQREATAFGEDSNQQRWYQAQQAGYTGPMPGAPAPHPAAGRGGGGGGAARGTGGARPPAGLANRIFAAGRAQQRRRGGR